MVQWPGRKARSGLLMDAKSFSLPTGKALRPEGCAWTLMGSGLRKRRQIQIPNQMLRSASCPPCSRPHPQEGHGTS